MANKVSFEVVSEVPATAPSTRKSQWDEVIANVPSEGALKIASESETQANGRMTGLREYLKKRGLRETYGYERQGSDLFVFKL